MKPQIFFQRAEIENILINRVKEIHPDVTGLSISWVKNNVIVYMDTEPKTIRTRTLKDDNT